MLNRWPTLAWGAWLLALLYGCGSTGPISPEQYAAFDRAGPVRPVVDGDKLQRARLPSTSEYAVVTGDVLAVTLPDNLASGAAESLGKGETYSLRVDGEGSISLPLAGKVKTAGKTLDAIEEAVAGAYYPKFTTRRPWVSVRVGEFATSPVTVLGAVKSPGVYSLRADEMSLVVALMKAGGVAAEGAAVIRIHPRGNGPQEAVVLPVKGLSEPFADAALKAADTVEVEQRPLEEYTVIGLVNKPGIYAYPATARYTLAQAVAAGGGLNLAADPQYAKVYRQAADGSLVSLCFNLRGSGDKAAAGVVIKPGDVVAVEDTPYTWTRVVLAQVLHLYAGATLPIH